MEIDYSSKIEKMLKKLNGHQLGTLMSLFFTDEGMVNFAYDAFIGGMETDGEWAKKRFFELKFVMERNNITPLKKSISINKLINK